MPRYRVFCREEEQDQLPESITVEESYPGFVVASGRVADVEPLRRKFPIEKLERRAQAERPRTRTTASSAGEEPSPGEVVLRFGLPVKKQWLDALKKKGVKVQCPFGGSAVVAHCPSKKVLAEALKHPAIEQIDPHVPSVRLTPGFFKGLGLKASTASVAKAAVQLANRKTTPDTSGRLRVPGEIVALFLTEQDRRRAEQKLRGCPERC